MTTKGLIINQIEKSIETKQAILSNPDLINLIDKAATVIIEAYKNGKKTLLGGNGGSAADAQHIAGEFVSKFNFNRPGLPSIALNTDTSILTAIGNDYGYDKLFARQVQAQGVKGDVFLAISTSGNSRNLVEALKTCKEKVIFSIGLTGINGGEMAELCDICIKVPSNETPRIQESHILIGHIICCIVEENIFGYLNPNKQWM
jgi:D-sedoheptulose 7-phosphate isomerase